MRWGKVLSVHTVHNKDTNRKKWAALYSYLGTIPKTSTVTETRLDSWWSSFCIRHLLLAIPEWEDETGEEDVSRGEEVRVLRSGPILYRPVAGREKTGLHADTDHTANLEDDLRETAANAWEPHRVST